MPKNPSPSNSILIKYYLSEAHKNVYIENFKPYVKHTKKPL